LNGIEQLQDLVKRKIINLGKLMFPTCLSKNLCKTCENYGGNRCLYIRTFQQSYFESLECKSCGKKAIMFNPYNNVINCHACGAAWNDEDAEKIMLN